MKSEQVHKGIGNVVANYPGYEIENFETEGGWCCTGQCTFCYEITEENMTNKARQPKVEKAVGNPDKGAPASTISVVSTTPNRLLGKPLEEGHKEHDKS